MRDALRAIRSDGGFVLDAGLSFPQPTVVDEAAYAVDVAALGEADIIRLQRRLDELEPRLLALEREPSVRALRKLRRAARTLRRRA